MVSYGNSGMGFVPCALDLAGAYLTHPSVGSPDKSITSSEQKVLPQCYSRPPASGISLSSANIASVVSSFFPIYLQERLTFRAVESQ